jgi:membrane protein DedA with SNARE-associated domain
MEQILHLVMTYGYLLIFALVFLDQAAVSIPSPPFVTALGVLASRGRFSIGLAFVVVFAAAFVADCMWFRIGRYATRNSFRLAGLRHRCDRFPQIVKLFGGEILGAIITAKFSLLPSALVPLAAGSSRLAARRFLYVASAANLAWTAAYLMGGFTAGYAIIDVLGRSSVLIVASLASCLPFAILFVLNWKLKRRNTFAQP